MAMDDDYYRYPAGSPEHYAAYEKEFNAGGIDPADDPEVAGDPETMYEIDNAWELARGWDEYADAMYEESVSEEIMPLLRHAENATLADFWAEAAPVPSLEPPDLELGE